MKKRKIKKEKVAFFAGLDSNLAIEPCSPSKKKKERRMGKE